MKHPKGDQELQSLLRGRLGYFYGKVNSFLHRKCPTIGHNTITDASEAVVNWLGIGSSLAVKPVYLHRKPCIEYIEVERYDPNVHAWTTSSDGPGSMD